MIENPVDAVFTWVDDSDQQWQRRHSLCLEKAGRLKGCNKSNTGKGRFRNRGELRYALRSIERYAPFLRKIYIVTDNQIPKWLNLDHPKITMVNHRDIFAKVADNDGANNSVTVPCFNSNVIQSHLHHISELAEHFIVFDDDVMLCSPVQISDFFSVDGNIIFYRDKRHFSYGLFTPHYWLDRYFYSGVISSSRRSCELLESKTGKGYKYRLMHTPHALTKKLMHKIDEVFADELAQNNTHQFRRDNDIKVTCALAQYYAYHHNDALMREGHLYMDYFSLSWFPFCSLVTPFRLRRYLQKSKFRLFFSVNDSTPSDKSKATHRAVMATLEQIFPQKSLFEI